MPKGAKTLHSHYDFIVIGAGIAGASVAAELADDATVLLLEMEAQPGYHTTGRSAAMFAPGYGPRPIRALTRASSAFFHNPPAGFAEAPLLRPRDVVMIARDDQHASLDALHSALAEDSQVRLIDRAELRDRLPLLRDGYADAAILDQTGSDIDVHALHQGYLRIVKARGGDLITGAEVTGASSSGGAWTVSTRAGEFKARSLINAAGAWADQLGKMAGAQPIGLVPKRRTAMIIAAPKGVDVDAMPLAVDVDEEFYLKPDAGRLLISPANEDPMDPCDAQPDELDIAFCVDRIERAFDLSVRRIENRWAGLRSFVADKAPVAGYDPDLVGFFWLAGQGGYGIQSSPALSRAAAALALNRAIPDDILAQRLDPISLSPERLKVTA